MAYLLRFDDSTNLSNADYVNLAAGIPVPSSSTTFVIRIQGSPAANVDHWRPLGTNANDGQNRVIVFGNRTVTLSAFFNGQTNSWTSPIPIAEIELMEFVKNSSGRLDLFINGSVVSGGFNNHSFGYNFNRIGANFNTGSRAFDLKRLQLEVDGTLIHDYDPSASTGTGTTLIDTVGGNNGTLVNFPTDNSQWVFYDDGAGEQEEKESNLFISNSSSVVVNNSKQVSTNLGINNTSSVSVLYDKTVSSVLSVLSDSETTFEQSISKLSSLEVQSNSDTDYSIAKESSSVVNLINDSEIQFNINVSKQSTLLSSAEGFVEYTTDKLSSSTLPIQSYSSVFYQHNADTGEDIRFSTLDIFNSSDVLFEVDKRVSVEVSDNNISEVGYTQHKISLCDLNITNTSEYSVEQIKISIQNYIIENISLFESEFNKLVQTNYLVDSSFGTEYGNNKLTNSDLDIFSIFTINIVQYDASSENPVVVFTLNPVITTKYLSSPNILANHKIDCQLNNIYQTSSDFQHKYEVGYEV